MFLNRNSVRKLTAMEAFLTAVCPKTKAIFDEVDASHFTAALAEKQILRRA